MQLLYEDNIVIVADTPDKFQQTVTEWHEELYRKGTGINTSKSKISQVGRQVEDHHIYCNWEEMEVVADFTYLGTITDRYGKIDSEISNRIRKAKPVYYKIENTLIGKREVGSNVKQIHEFVYLLILLNGTESWILTDRQESHFCRNEVSAKNGGQDDERSCPK
ncbi:uncharacterized protein [Halyomorpha halys]|uniref:uncharacterized protein n=1 Tax=Halyomorpha halys TaxID=286706 RepID=UPI0006D508EA|nr:uncharacterized protein LOC106687724 [Halyomorpha halys]